MTIDKNGLQQGVYKMLVSCRLRILLVSIFPFSWDEETVSISSTFHTPRRYMPLEKKP